MLTNGNRIYVYCFSINTDVEFLLIQQKKVAVLTNGNRIYVYCFSINTDVEFC